MTNQVESSAKLRTVCSSYTSNNNISEQGEVDEAKYSTALLLIEVPRIGSQIAAVLPERVRQRALEMADDADLRKRPPHSFTEQISLASEQTTVIDPGRNPRLPPPGDQLHKTYKGQKLVVHVGENSFEFNGTTYGTLSAAAKAISGSHVNGFTFFGLKGNKERAK